MAACIHCIILGKYLVNEIEEDSILQTLFAGHYLTSITTVSCLKFDLYNLSIYKVISIKFIKERSNMVVLFVIVLLHFLTLFASYTI